MNNKIEPSKSISRRGFLKFGCLATGAVGLTLCGIGTAATAPDSSPVDLPSNRYGSINANRKILVAYASSFGSTASIADEIGRAISAQGFGVDVRPIVDKPSIEGYQAVVIGSAIHFGSWLPEAAEFVKENLTVLKDVPVALFCVHMRNTDDSEESRQIRQAFLDSIRPMLNVIDEGFFGGKFDQRGAVMLLPGIIGRFCPTLDYLNLEMVKIWGEQVSSSLAQLA